MTWKLNKTFMTVIKYSKTKCAPTPNFRAMSNWIPNQHLWSSEVTTLFIYKETSKLYQKILAKQWFSQFLPKLKHKYCQVFKLFSPNAECKPQRCTVKWCREQLSPRVHSLNRVLWVASCLNCLLAHLFSTSSNYTSRQNPGCWSAARQLASAKQGWGEPPSRSSALGTPMIWYREVLLSSMQPLNVSHTTTLVQL